MRPVTRNTTLLEILRFWANLSVPPNMEKINREVIVRSLQVAAMNIGSNGGQMIDVKV